MAKYEVSLPSGEKYDVDVPEGQDPKVALSHATQMLSRQSQPQQSSVMNEVTRPFRTMGNEFAQGMKQFGTYQPAEPGSMTDFVTRGPTGGPLEIPRNPVSDVLASTANQGMGLLRALGAPVTAFGDLVGHALGGLSRQVGAPETVSQGVEQAGNIGGQLMAPAGIANMIPQALQRIGYAAAAPGSVPLRAADMATKAAEESNVFANLRNETAQANYQKSLAEFNRLQQENQANAVAGQAAHAEALRRVSEKEKALMVATQKATPMTTNEQAYSFMNGGQAMPPIEIPKLKDAADRIMGELGGVPKSLQPTKLGTVAKEVAGESGLPEGMTKAQAEAWGPVLDQIKEIKGGLEDAPTLDKLQQVGQGLGRMTQSTDPRVAGAARHLYKNMMEDVANAAKTVPEAQKYLDATKIARQNYAAEDLADFMTNSGTRVNKLGQIEVQPQKLAQKLREGDFGSLAPEARAEIERTLEDVFQARKGVPEIVKQGRQGPAPKEPKPESLLPEEITPKKAAMGSRYATSAAGAAVMSAAGIPYHMAVPAAIMYPRLIFRAALNPVGRRLLRTLYADLPPGLNDTARMGAVINFLRSQGEQIDIPKSIDPAQQMPQQGVPGGQQ